MKILGIADGMTGGTALVEDGRLVYAVHEERLIRAKMATGFPRRSICRVLEDTQTRPEEIEAIAIPTVNEFFRETAVAYNGWFRGEEGPLKKALLTTSSQVTRVFGTNPLLQNSYYRLKSILGRTRRKALDRLLRRDWGFSCPIHFIDHHFAHACSAYYTSGFGDATVVTMDGAGDNLASAVYLVKNGRFQRLWNVDSLNSIGNYYAYVTHLCGFNAHKHEGKITGLAAYGKPLYADLLRRFVAFEAGTVVNKRRVFHSAALEALKRALPALYRREDLAASMQQVLEEVCCAYVEHWVDQTGCGELALAGGVFANVKLNQRIHDLSKVRSLFIHPGMGDEGLAVGAAFAVSSSLKGALRENVSSRLTDVYLGPAYREGDLERAAREQGLCAEFQADMERKIAELIAHGYVVARFDGRMEYGPRALGNRSILCQATDPTVNDWLNKQLRRTEFMPFAPVTLEESADQCYLGLDGAREAARFMTITFDCTDWMKQHCPAVVHVDGTARPQLIDRATNPSYFRILEEYRKLTGLPCMINTSFNMHEEPIVCSPEDAVKAFKQGHLDYLALGNYLLTHPRLTNTAELAEERVSKRRSSESVG